MIVYGLIDPRTQELRYVGQTVRAPETRLKQHLRTATGKTTPPVNAWIRSLLCADLQPEYLVLEVAGTPQELDDAEVFWIEYATFLGCTLLNRASGGQSRRGWHHTDSVRSRMSVQRKGRPSGVTGYQWTEKQKREFRARGGWRGHPRHEITDETRAKMRASRLAYHAAHGVSPATRARLAERMVRRWNENTEYRKKMVGAVRELWATDPEYRKRALSGSQKANQKRHQEFIKRRAAERELCLQP